MTIVTKGPAVEMPDWDGPNFDISLRWISEYRVMSDDMITRLDVLMKVPRQGPGLECGIRPGVQFCVAFRSSSPGEADLHVPKHLPAAIAVRVTASDLVAAFRGLADRIEQEMSTS